MIGGSYGRGVVISCTACGKEVTRRGYAQKRCPECARLVRLDQMSDYSRRRWSDRYSESHQLIKERALRWQRENPALREAAQRRSRERDLLIDATRSNLPWTAAEDAVLASWGEGIRELGSVLGRSVDSIKTRRRDIRRRAADQSTSNEGVSP